MILAIGYKVKGIRGIQFRRWATEHLSKYLVKGFTMDDERLKNPDGRPDYFDAVFGLFFVVIIVEEQLTASTGLRLA